MNSFLQLGLRYRGTAAVTSAAIIVALLAACPWLMDTYYLNLLFMIGTFVITCTGMNLLIGYCGIVSIGHAGLMATGAYVSSYLSTQAGLSFWVVALAGMLMSLVIGSLIAIPTIKAGGVYLSMITIAFGVVIHEVLIRWDAFTGGPLGISGIPKPELGGYRFDLKSMYLLVLAVSVLVLVLIRNLRRSAWGRAMIATKENEIAAASLGIRKFAVQYAGFAFSAVLAGLSGAIYAHANSFISPDTYHFQTSVQLVLIVILGGAGTVLGPVVGATILVFLPELLQMEKLRMALYGGIMFAVLFFLPKGIVGTAGQLLGRKIRGYAKTGPSPARERNSETPQLFAHASSSGAVMLELNGIHKHFGGLHALKDVSFSVATGAVHSLVGPNGAGKTTLLNVISGLYSANQGTLSLRGKSLNPRSLSDVTMLGIARTFQHSRLFKELTVLENVMVGMAGRRRVGFAHALLHTPKQRRDERVMEERAHLLLDLIGYEGDRDMPASQLPYGHQRMVEIARALATEPDLLLLDEPAAGMTAAEIGQLEQLLRKLTAYGLTIILIEHHMDFVQRISDTVTVLDFGKVIGTGKPEEMLTDPRVIQAYLGAEEVAAGA
ncbi:ABC-type branched-subunit amino acid transport system ATPase component/ABC-type branched-subunit amino acid transport system permease subunit [Paenibacillus phyllosphaerae]|uniref:ABC-type branched-subunit amino acid transport system ATPase component/ABC-type branched-subunit amino acid transport system permease subunit n=1 Tax=Paenibacillus phyllosphaerae TaxID=274593 RepID=A0A7W5B4J0_9BACL|nr:branched-chain amino acid ABC transporter ATP-binding protein/permease [Paenibacillus phyllosphaerae]MBB3113806.1 ABC-type branched-subunit amino acid transport system ATPase component/ABC-type branched-subunit amino acid transport system permease subunit [Paenibacillus phyllosphaerae]